jgi:hypothetical protein
MRQSLAALLLLLGGTGSLAQNAFPSTGNVGIGTTTPSYTLDVNGLIHSSTGIVFPDGTTQTSALNSGGSSLKTGDSNYGNINVTLNGANVPVIYFTRWTGTGTIQNNASVGLFLNSSDSFYDFGIGTGVSTTGSQIASNIALTVTQAGNVGIGTTAPGSDLSSLPSPPAATTPILEVNGDIALTQGSGGQMFYADGTVQSTAWNGVLTGGDYAESVNVVGDRTRYEPGDVLVIDTTSEGGFLRSAQPYSTAVTGIYSTKPGVIGRRQKTDPSNMKDEVPMAMTGIVPTKVSAENGPFHSGPVTSNLSSREHKPTISSGKVRRRAYKQWNHYSA